MTWDYTEEQAKKQAKHDPLWHFERILTYGLNGELIKRTDLAQYLDKIKLPKERKAFLELLVWGKQF